MCISPRCCSCTKHKGLETCVLVCVCGGGILKNNNDENFPLFDSHTYTLPTLLFYLTAQRTRGLTCIEVLRTASTAVGTCSPSAALGEGSRLLPLASAPPLAGMWYTDGRSRSSGDGSEGGRASCTATNTACRKGTICWGNHPSIHTATIQQFIQQPHSKCRTSKPGRASP